MFSRSNNIDDGGIFGNGGDEIGRRRPVVLPPLDFGLQREGNALRPFVKERPRFISKTAVSDATKYMLFWAADMDATTSSGRAAGKRRADSIGSIDRTFIGDQRLYGPLLADAKFASGYFMCVATNDEGDESQILVASAQTGAILDSGIPANVTDLQISESGKQQQDTVLSAVSFTYIVPRPKRSFLGIIPVIDDYPNIGDRTYFGAIASSAPSGGAGGGLLKIAQCRRLDPAGLAATITIAGGTPTIVTGTGSSFTLIAKAGDQIEIFGRRYRISTVDSNTQITLTAGYPTTVPAVTALAAWAIIGKCRVYAVSYSQAFTAGLIDANTPFKDVDLDGDLSAPNAPATLTLTNFGNGIRGQFAQVTGEGIKEYVVFKSSGSTDQFTTPGALSQVGKAIPHDPTTAAANTLLTFEDVDFSYYDREQGTIFRYYVITRNVRDDPSTGYATDTEPCRLDSPSDGGATYPARFVAFTLLWNGMFSGTAGAVSTADAVQDTQMNIARPAGFNRWDGATTGTGAAPGFQNVTEVILANAGAAHAIGASILFQRISAWDSANGRVPKGKIVFFQVKAYHTAGTFTGSLVVTLEQKSGGVHKAWALVRQRLSNDTFNYSTSLVVTGGNILAAAQIYFCAFALDNSVPTDELILSISYDTLNYNGVNLVITEPMLSLGDGMPYWSPIIDPNTLYIAPGAGATIPSGEFPDRDGSRRDWILLP